MDSIDLFVPITAVIVMVAVRATVAISSFMSFVVLSGATV